MKNLFLAFIVTTAVTNFNLMGSLPGIYRAPAKTVTLPARSAPAAPAPAHAAPAASPAPAQRQDLPPTYEEPSAEEMLAVSLSEFNKAAAQEKAAEQKKAPEIQARLADLGKILTRVHAAGISNATFIQYLQWNIVKQGLLITNNHLAPLAESDNLAKALQSKYQTADLDFERQAKVGDVQNAIEALNRQYRPIAKLYDELVLNLLNRDDRLGDAELLMRLEAVVHGLQ